MRGLRTQEDNEFLIFFKIVQEEANKRGFVFFMDFGECKDIKYKDMILDELFGWGIPLNKADTFEKLYNDRNIAEKWDKYCIWVIPESKNGNLIINFE